MTVRDTIISEFETVARDQGKKLVPLDDNTRLLETGLDSLCFAIIVARLDDQLGIDPFQSETGSFPKTVGDFVRLYENAGRAAAAE
jgi:acyl carrier protein